MVFQVQLFFKKPFKKGVLNLETDVAQNWNTLIHVRPKKSSLVSGNRLGEFLYDLPVRICQMGIRINVFCFKKSTYTNKKFLLANLFARIYVFFSLQKIKDRFVFQQRKVLLVQFFKCKNLLKTKYFFESTQVEIFFVTAFPETIVLFFLALYLTLSS